MASNNRHNTAFVVGSVLGAVAGAAVALWKTPYSGQELRSKLGASVGHETTGAQDPTASSTAAGERSLKDKVLSSVEKTLAPVVGVELGKTANTSGATPMDSGDIQVKADYGTTMLRHPHAWTDETEEETTSGTGSERITGARTKVDAEKWAQAYGTTPDSGSRYASKEEESEAQTGLGAKPAYPGNDQSGRQPMDNEAPDSSVADVSQDAGVRSGESDLSVEDAASVDDLTTPQVHRVPDSQKEIGDASYRPFPKLGGKEG